jgi:AbrB family looped-hinge helix DNA binding protein
MPFRLPSAMVSGMTVRIDKSGRIVLPKMIRERFGLVPDLELDVIEQPGGVLLRHREEIPSMIKIDGLWIHQGTPHSNAQWDRLIDDVREERAQSVFMT